MDEAAITRQLAGEGLAATRWSNSPGAVYPLHDHAYAKVLIVAHGSIDFFVGEPERRVTMQPGTRLELPAKTAHRAIVGSAGVVCLEAQAPTAQIGAVRVTQQRDGA